MESGTNGSSFKKRNVMTRCIEMSARNGFVKNRVVRVRLYSRSTTVGLTMAIWSIVMRDEVHY